jgi:hypothetical protein
VLAYPLVNIHWKQRKALASKADNSVVESGQLGLCGRGTNLGIWVKMCVVMEALAGSFDLVLADIFKLFLEGLH